MGFRSLSLPPLTKCSGSAHACSACVNGHNFMIVLTTCDKGSDEPAQVCILQSSIDGSGMSSITAFMLNGLILCLTTQTTTWIKALLYISELSKFTQLFNAVVCTAFFLK